MVTSVHATATLSRSSETAILLPSVCVCITQPGDKLVEANLGMTPLVVGTSPECDVVLSDSRVSRRHCELQLTESGVKLRDLGSKNGTFLHDVRIVEIILPLNVPVQIGSSRLSLRVAGPPSSVPLFAADRFGGAIGKSVVMRALFAKLDIAAKASETILLLGESGTGKEVLAQAIHGASPRSGKPFVVFDCSVVAANLVESELFGHVRGAFTGAMTSHMGLLEQANTGTLFIDEIGDLPLDLQPKLLRALETRKVRRVGSNEWIPFDVRVVAATHRNLKSLVDAGAFRQDLYFRLAVVEVNVPSLREHKEDIPQLVEHFVTRQQPPRSIADLPPHSMALLEAHDWPGNVRELRNVVARLMLFQDLGRAGFDPSPIATIDSMRKTSVEATAKSTEPTSKSKEATEVAAVRDEQDEGLGHLLKLPMLEATEAVMDQFKKRYITAKLREHGGNVSRTADAIGISRQHLHRLIERYGLRIGDK